MPILDYNVDWMLLNCFLALLPLGFGYFFITSKNKAVKVICGILWVLFLPNTIYIFTDLEHIIDQWPLVPSYLRIILLLQYVFLEFVGITTFLIGIFPFEKMLMVERYVKKKITKELILFNFFIAFGMVLGRVERINSWEVFTNPLKVLNSAMHVITTFDLFGLMILFGLLCNFIYFLFRDRVLYSMKSFFHELH